MHISIKNIKMFKSSKLPVIEPTKEQRDISGYMIFKDFIKKRFFKS
jgi:hypothetical protein